DFASFADPRRPFDHGALLHHGAFADEHRAGNERLADHAALDRGLEAKLQVGDDLLQGVPDVDGGFEEHPVLRVIQIHVVRRGEGGRHGARGGEKGRRMGLRGRMGLILGCKRQWIKPQISQIYTDFGRAREWDSLEEREGYFGLSFWPSLVSL